MGAQSLIDNSSNESNHERHSFIIFTSRYRNGLFIEALKVLKVIKVASLVRLTVFLAVHTYCVAVI